MAKNLRLIRSEVDDGRSVRVKRFWEIMSEGGNRLLVVNGWNSWPAEPLRGIRVSDRVHYWRVASRFDGAIRQEALAYPESLVEAAQP